MQRADETSNPSGVGHFSQWGLIVSSMESKDEVYMPCEVVKLTPQVRQHNIDFAEQDFDGHYAFSTKVSYSIMLFLVCLIGQM